eukprot:5175986-Pleurochrysis_carterae.AAC.1
MISVSVLCLRARFGFATFAAAFSLSCSSVAAVVASSRAMVTAIAGACVGAGCAACCDGGDPSHPAPARS